MDSTEQTPERLIAQIENERRKVRWDPTINTGHLLSAGTSIIASLVFVMASWATMDKRVVVLEEARLAQAVSVRERQEVINDKISDVKQSLQDIKNSIENIRRDAQQDKHK